MDLDPYAVTLQLTHLQASHQGVDNDCSLQCLLLQRIVTAREVDSLPRPLPAFLLDDDDYPLSCVPQSTSSCLHRLTPLTLIATRCGHLARCRCLDPRSRRTGVMRVAGVKAKVSTRATL